MPQKKLETAPILKSRKVFTQNILSLIFIYLSFRSKKETVIGKFLSAGSTNGSLVYMGPRGGVYYYTDVGNNKRFLNEQQKASNIVYLSG